MQSYTLKTVLYHRISNPGRLSFDRFT